MPVDALDMWHGHGRMRSGRDRLQVLGGGQQFVLDPASGGRRGRRRGIGRRAAGGGEGEPGRRVREASRALRICGLTGRDPIRSVSDSLRRELARSDGLRSNG